MALIAMNPDSPPELRGRMYAELAGYVAPKRRALDVAATNTAPVLIRLGIGKKPSVEQAEVVESGVK